MARNHASEEPHFRGAILLKGHTFQEHNRATFSLDPASVNKLSSRLNVLSFSGQTVSMARQTRTTTLFLNCPKSVWRCKINSMRCSFGFFRGHSFKRLADAFETKAVWLTLNATVRLPQFDCYLSTHKRYLCYEALPSIITTFVAIYREYTVLKMIIF